MDAQQLQQLLTAVTTGLTCPAGAFALAPGQVDPTNALDYTMSSGIKIWHEATAPLSFKCNIDGKEVNTFCEALAQRAQQSGWTLTRANVIMINNSSNPAVAQNIITEYGLLTVNNITTFCDTLDWKQHLLSSEQLPDVHMHHGFTYQRWSHQDSC
jgi:hypothetical protein